MGSSSHLSVLLVSDIIPLIIRTQGQLEKLFSLMSSFLESFYAFLTALSGQQLSKVPSGPWLTKKSLRSLHKCPGNELILMDSPQPQASEMRLLYPMPKVNGHSNCHLNRSSVSLLKAVDSDQVQSICLNLSSVFVLVLSFQAQPSDSDLASLV